MPNAAIREASYRRPAVGVSEREIQNSAVELANEVQGHSLAKEKIFFLKTHKTGSSTVENILMRAALKYNLTLARPKLEYALHFAFHRPLSASDIRPIPDFPKVPSILAQHTLLSPQVDLLYPKNTSYRFSILRGKGLEI